MTADQQGAEPEHEVVAAVRDAFEELRAERDALLDLLELTVGEVVGSSPVDGLSLVRIPGFVMAEIRDRLATRQT